MTASTTATEIGCDCGTFRAALTAFPKNTPGRLVCYCADCQTFLSRIDRQDRLDQFGGTEIVPVYPADIDVTHGIEELRCHRLTETGPCRWTSRCCNSPVANTRPGFPWVGVFHSMFTRLGDEFSGQLGDVRCRIYGRDAEDGAPFKISHKIKPADMLVVLPFILKGRIFRMHRNSPFFLADGTSPVTPLHELNAS